MESSHASFSRYRFGPFVLDVAEGSLIRNGYRVKLQDLPFRLLLMLAERPGEIITRDEMRQHLWAKGTFVEFDNSLGVAVRKIRDALGDDSDSPRYLETVPRRGYRFLAPVTVLESQRPSDDAVAHETQTDASVPGVISEAAASSAIPPARRTRRLWPRNLAAASLLGLLTWGILHEFRSVSLPTISDAHAGSLGPVVVRRSVAVLGFRNLPNSPEDNWLSPAFAEMLTTELASDGAIRLIPGEDVARVKRELPVSDEDSLGKDTLARLKANPGADLVVLGSYTPIPGAKEKRIRLDVRVQETARGETVAERSFTGSQAELFELVTQAGQAIRQSLGIQAESSLVAAQARAAMPSNEQAIRFYVDGKQRLWSFDTQLARDLLVKSVAADPAFPLSHASLSEAFWSLGYRQKARAEAERARALSGHLGAEEKALIEAQFYITFSNNEKATEIFQDLFKRFPDSLYYGLRLADEQRLSNIDAAMRTIGSLRHLPLPSANDPRIDLIESRAWMTRDVSKAHAAAHRGLEIAQQQGSPLLIERAYGILCQSESGGADAEEVAKDCGQAMQNARAAGETDGVARAANDLAGFYFVQGRVDQAQELFQESLDLFKKRGDLDGISTVESNLGAIMMLKGDGQGALRAISDSIPGYREEDDKDGIALALNNLGDVERMGGNWKDAASDYAKGEGIAKEIDDRNALGYIYTGIGDLQTDRGDLQTAEASYTQALILRKQAKELQFIAETEVRRGLLLIEQGKPAEAAEILQRCKMQFHKDHQADDELESSIALSNALADQAKLSEAHRVVDDSKNAATATMSVELRLEMEIASARVEFGLGQIESARTHLNDAVRQATIHHLPGIELRGRLRLAELKVKAGHATAARTDLIALENSAHARGFELIAGKARSERVDMK